MINKNIKTKNKSTLGKFKDSIVTRFLQNDRTILLFVIFLAIFTRIWRLPELLHWTMDEEYWSYVVHNVATGFHFPLIGGSAAGTGLYLGPLYVWIVGVYGAIFGTHPLSMGIFASSLGILTIVSILTLLPILKPRFENKTPDSVSISVSMLTAFLYTISVFAQIYDRKYWNASPLPLLSVLTLYLAHQIIHKPKVWTPFALAFITSLAFHAHLSGIVLTLFVFTIFTIYELPKKIIGWYLLFFILFQTPLVLFDLKHDFTNTKALSTLATQTSEHSQNLLARSAEAGKIIVTTFSRVLYTPATDISRELTLCSEYASTRTLPPIGFYVLSLTILVYALTQLKAKNIYAILLFVNIGSFFMFRALASDKTLYPGQLSEYYLLSSLVAFFALASDLIIKLHKHLPIAAYSLVIFLAAINLNRTSELIHTNSLALKDTQVKNAISQLADHTFGLNVVGDKCQVFGYRYLFTVYGREPDSSYLDASFGWLYQTPPSPIPPEKSLIINATSATIEITDVQKSP